MSIFKPVSSDARRLFAKRLRQIRQVKGLSQEALADLAGLHRTYVGSVERSERNVSIDNMERLAKALEVDITELLRDESELTTPSQRLEIAAKHRAAPAEP